MTTNSLFLVLGNQLFPLKHINKYKSTTIFMAEDLELCTYQKHHKLKIILFLSSMRSYYDLLKKEKFKVQYFDISNDFNIPYIKKLEKFISKNKIQELISFEIEDKPFEIKILKLVKKNLDQYLKMYHSQQMVNLDNHLTVYLLD